VLDTTGKIVSLDGYKNGILITKDKVIFKAAEGGRTKVEEYDLSKVKISPFIVKSGDAQRGELLHLTIGKKILSITKNSIDKAGNVISLLVFAIMVLFMFGLFLNTKLFQIFIFSLVSLIINSLSSGRLKYVYLLNIGTYAITVPTVVSVFLILFPVTGKQTLLKLWPLFYILLYLVFLYLAIVRCKQAEESQAA